jgi:hypothetical protein
MSHLLNYLDTWSAVQKYRLENKIDPLELIKNELKPYWEDTLEKKPITWAINLKVGVIK